MGWVSYDVRTLGRYNVFIGVLWVSDSLIDKTHLVQYICQLRKDKLNDF